MCGRRPGCRRTPAACCQVHLRAAAVTSTMPRWYGCDARAVAQRRGARQLDDGQVDLDAGADAAVGLDRGQERRSGRSAAVAQPEERALAGRRSRARAATASPRRRPAGRRPRGRPRPAPTRPRRRVRISAPASRAASAIAPVTTPMPPRTKPQRRTPPPASSQAWSCSSTKAVPGVDGPATLSLIACQPSAALTCVGLEPLVQVLRGRRREQVSQRRAARPRWRDARRRQPAIAQPRTSRGARTPRVGRASSRRSAGPPATSPASSSSNAGQRPGVGRGEPADRLDVGRPCRRRAGSVAPSAIEVEAGARRVDDEAALDQAHVAPDRRSRSIEST